MDVASNGYASLQENGSGASINYQDANGDYTSLPPSTTAVINSETGLNNQEELNSEHRRYSDPGLGPAQQLSDTQSENSDSEEEDDDTASSITTIGRGNKILLTLVEQVYLIVF